MQDQCQNINELPKPIEDLFTFLSGCLRTNHRYIIKPKHIKRLKDVIEKSKEKGYDLSRYQDVIDELLK